MVRPGKQAKLSSAPPTASLGRAELWDLVCLLLVSARWTVETLSLTLPG